MIVKKLTPTQKAKLENKKYSKYKYFNPIQDINDTWVISMEEVEQCNSAEFSWIKTLPSIDFMPKPYNINDVGATN